MKIEFVDEPELEFGAGRHVDVRFGLMNYLPLDFGLPDAPKSIRLGVIGTAATIDGALRWLEKCAAGLAAKESKQPNLFPRFPGFGADSPFRCGYVCEARHQQTLLSAEIVRVTGAASPMAAVREAAELFADKVNGLTESGSVDVVICAPPSEMLDAMDPEQPKDGQDAKPGDDTEAVDDGEPERKLDFHDFLKARAMPSGKPIQIVLPETYGGKSRRKSSSKRKGRVLQDEATRAWNFFAAMYYKAGGTPWRLPRDPSDITTCFVGVSFFRTVDEESVWTSVAQVFNERGDGIVVRGEKAVLSKEDRRPCLTADASRSVLTDALKRYRDRHYNAPARVVLHKTSRFTPDEIVGFSDALNAERIQLSDFLSVAKAGTRLFRTEQYPPLRGTLLTLDDKHHAFYTRGGVDFFETYTGLYVPRALLFRCERVERTPRQIAEEILALTKMNWNCTQFDNRDPITVKAAREVGAVLKHLRPSDKVFPRYSFYI
jgi:hypothetical protein